MTDPKTPNKVERIKEGMANVVDSVPVQTGRRLIGGAFHAVNPWNEERLGARKAKKDDKQAKAQEEQAKLQEIESILDYGRQNMAIDSEVRSDVDRIFSGTLPDGWAAGSTNPSNTNANPQNPNPQRSAETNSLKGLKLLKEMVRISGKKEAKLFANFSLLSCVLKLLHDLHHNQQLGKKNTIIEKLNLSADNLCNILSIIFGSLRGGGTLDKSEIRKLIRDDEISAYDILYSQGFMLDEDIDKNLLTAKIDEFNEVADNFKQLRAFLNVYQDEKLGSKNISEALVRAYNKIKGGGNIDAVFSSSENMPKEFDNEHAFDEKVIARLSVELNKIQKIKPNTKQIEEIDASGELSEELEFLKMLADAFFVSDKDYNSKHKNVHFEGKDRVDVLNQINDEINDKMGENLGSILYDISRNGKANGFNILEGIAKNFLADIESKDSLIKKVKKIYETLQGIYPKLKESNRFYVKRVREESREELADDIFDKL